MLTSALRRAADRVRRSADAGVTLIELMVAMTLTTIVSAMAMLAFTSANSAVNSTGDQLSGTGSARVVIAGWTALLQSADTPQLVSGPCSTGAAAHRFEWMTPTDTLFYANIGNRLVDGTANCTPPTMIWLGLRNGALLEARYTVTGSTTFTLSTCRTLNETGSVLATTGSLFTPNPGTVLPTSNYGRAFSLGSPFGAITSCASMPTTVTPAAVSNTDTTAVNALAQIASVGVDFSLADRQGLHAQNFDSTAAVLGSAGA